MPLTKKLIPVKSSVIASVGWLSGRGQDADRIAIRFHNGRVKFYPATPLVWQRLMTADSIGRFYNQNLKRHRAADCSGASAHGQRPDCKAVNLSDRTTVSGGGVK